MMVSTHWMVETKAIDQLGTGHAQLPSAAFNSSMDNAALEQLMIQSINSNFKTVGVTALLMFGWFLWKAGAQRNIPWPFK